jgi:hypothetical protein
MLTVAQNPLGANRVKLGFPASLQDRLGDRKQRWLIAEIPVPGVQVRLNPATE